MIHISEATEEMGCLRVYPGSHRHGRVENSTATNAAFHERFPFEGSTAIEAEPGRRYLLRLFHRARIAVQPL